MSDDGSHGTSTRDKIVRMTNQIGTFFQSKPHEEGVEGTAEHINKFWEPRMRRMFFELLAESEDGFLPIVVEASKMVRRPNAPQGAGVGAGADANRGGPGGKGVAAGESVGEIAASQN